MILGWDWQLFDTFMQKVKAMFYWLHELPIPSLKFIFLFFDDGLSVTTSKNNKNLRVKWSNLVFILHGPLLEYGGP